MSTEASEGAAVRMTSTIWSMRGERPVMPNVSLSVESARLSALFSRLISPNWSARSASIKTCSGVNGFST